MNPMKKAVRNKNGVTLVELIVAIAVGIMLAEIIFGIFISTNKATEKSNSRVLLYSEARTIDKQIQNIIKKRIPEAEILTPGQASLASFTENAVRVYSPAISEKQYKASLITIKNQTTPDNKNNRIIAFEESFDPAGAVLEGGAVKDLGTQGDRIKAKIKFKFANEFEGLEPKLVDSITTGTKLIQYTITLEDIKKDYGAISFTSAVSY